MTLRRVIHLTFRLGPDRLKDLDRSYSKCMHARFEGKEKKFGRLYIVGMEYMLLNQKQDPNFEAF